MADDSGATSSERLVITFTVKATGLKVILIITQAFE